MLFALYYMCDYSKLNGKGRERRRPGTAAGPEVTPSTWDAIVRAGPGGYMCYAILRVGPKGYMSYPRGENRNSRLW